jgi:pantetheine-phosphate adenylyltransferase
MFSLSSPLYLQLIIINVRNLKNKSEEFPFKVVGLGGSFDHLHPGHHVLIQTAFKLGKHVAIGLSTENLLNGKQFRDKIQPYKVREDNLRKYIESTLHVPKQNYTIIPLDDPFGPAITNPDLDAHVSSQETYLGSLKINELRIKNGLNPLTIVIIPLVLDSKGEKFSSTTIRAKN